MEIGLYIHIPFCVKRCNYCDFYTFGGHTFVPQEYIDAVIKEIKKYQPFVCKTVYFGGGTPSLLQPQQVKCILDILDIKENGEITLEANPETLTQEKLNGYYDAGVNRLSFGVQTASKENLQSLGRIHSNQSVKDAFEMAKKAGFTNISGDLMLGLNNYTFKEIDDTIDLINSCGATHISAYMLKVEQGTPYYKNTPENLSTEEQLEKFYLYSCRKLERLGYIQYEISNFAKEGYHSRHNCIYWNLENYLGVGPSAHSCIDGKRFHYSNDLKEFLQNPNVQQDGVLDKDDYIMLSLRLKSGLDTEVLQKKWNKTFTASQNSVIENMHKNGLINYDGKTIALTPKGFLVENEIACRLML